jgi:hypothetical protein
MSWIDIPHPLHPGRLAFRYDPERDLIELQDRREKCLVDLSEVRVGSVQKQAIDMSDNRLYDKGSSRTCEVG